MFPLASSSNVSIQNRLLDWKLMKARHVEYPDHFVKHVRTIGLCPEDFITGKTRTKKKKKREKGRQRRFLAMQSRTKLSSSWISAAWTCFVKHLPSPHFHLRCLPQCPDLVPFPVSEQPSLLLSPPTCIPQWWLERMIKTPVNPASLPKIRR